MIYNRSFFTSKRTRKSHNGSAITETAVGALVLMPIFLILVDLIALVVGQTINDDIAKNAARYAAQGSDSNSANTLAQNYINSTPYQGGAGFLVTSAQIISFNWTPVETKVVTEITIKLPIGVPLLNIRDQNMQSQATFPSIGVSAPPPGVGAAAS